MLGFWIPLTVFCGWFVSMFYLIRRSLLEEMHEAEQLVTHATA